MGVKLAELAVRFGCELRGDPDTEIDDVGTLEGAGAHALSFFANPRYRAALRGTSAGAVVVDPDAAAECPVAVLISDNPYAAYARMAAFLKPSRRPPAGVHPTAGVDDTARVAVTAAVGPNVVIGARSVVHDDAWLGPGVVIGEDCVVGERSRIHANATLGDDVHLGRRVIVHPGAVLGADGFGLAREPAGWIKVPQLGGVRIGDDVEIGACTTVDRGAIEHTVIEHGVKLDNQIQVAHNVRIGAHTVVAACSGISGSTEIGQRCIIAGMVGFVGHITIADDVVVTGRSMVSRSLGSPGTYSGALPVDEAGRWRKNSARFRKLDELARRLAAVEKQLARAEQSGDDDD